MSPLPVVWRLALPALGAWLAFVAVTKYPGEYWSEKARVALRDERYSDAAAFARRGIKHETRNPFLYQHLGDALRRDKQEFAGSAKNQADLQAAADAFRTSIAIFERDEVAWIRLGQTLDAMADYKNARAAYLRAIELDPRFAKLHAYYAIHLRRVGREAEAQRVILEGSELSQWSVNNVIGELLAPSARKNK
jgi:tetratricopeptide (TPR) repeat protein